MPYNCQIYDILIASPSDVHKERDVLRNVIFNWNSLNGKHYNIMFSPVMWEHNVIPEMGNHPQEVVNKQIVDQCDILIGIFWTRLGTPTNKESSGTVEEIKNFIRNNKPAMIYMSATPIVPDSIDLEQYQNLKNFKSELFKSGVIEIFDNIDDFRNKVENHLTLLAQKLSSILEKIAISDGNQSKNEGILNRILKEINSLEIEWLTEKNSEPGDIDGGKYILEKLSFEIIHFLKEYSDNIKGKNQLVQIITNLKIIQEHSLYLDGGRSYQKFWENGDLLFEETIKYLSFEIDK